MTVAGIIEQYNAERPNTVEDNIKVVWLRKCERMLINELILTHEHDVNEEDEISLKVEGSTLYITPAGTLEDHIDTFDLDTELIVPEPYDDLYIYYIDQRIASNNNDTRRYNAAAAQYNNALLTYQQYLNRHNTPLKPRKFTINHSTL